MPFNESNKNLEQNLEIKHELEKMQRHRVCLCALFFLEHKVNRKRKIKVDENTYKACLEGLFKAVEGNSLFSEMYAGFSDFCYQTSLQHRRTRWYGLDCVLDSLDAVTKRPGAIEYHRRNEIKGIVGIVLEEYYEIPISDIIKDL